MTTTTVRNWGNSVAVRLPKAVARKLHLVDGSVVRVFETSDKTIEIKPVAHHALDLATLVSQITPQNRHKEIDWGAPRGKEIW